MKDGKYPKLGDKPPCKDNDSFRGYQQVYVTKHKTGENSHDSREAFFQCGNWCYDGIISLDFLGNNKEMSLSDIPKVAPTLQQQQQDLSFVCLSSKYVIAVEVIYSTTTTIMTNLTEFCLTTHLIYFNVLV